MNYYEAKFEREKKRKPSDWVITPALDSRGLSTGKYSLVQVCVKKSKTQFEQNLNMRLI